MIDCEPGKQIRISVTAKASVSFRYSTASLRLCDDHGFLGSCELVRGQPPAKGRAAGDKAVQSGPEYEFTVALRCLKQSRFQFVEVPEGNDKEPIPSLQTYWFYLGEFIDME